MMNKLEKLINNKIRDGKYVSLRKLYLENSNYKIKRYEKENAKALLIYSEELIERPEFKNLMLELYENVKNLNLIIAKRTLRISFKKNTNIEKEVLQQVQDINFERYQYVILFCPHLIFDQAVLINLKGKIKTICLQHGYYSYGKKEYELYKELNYTDIAIQYDNKTDDFFSNCDINEHIGEYAHCNQIETEIINASMIYIPYVYDMNRDYILTQINKIEKEVENKIIIRRHPMQSINKIKEILGGCKYIYDIKDLKQNIVGTSNFYIETTAWSKVKYPNGANNNYLIKDGKWMLIKKEMYPNSTKLIKKIVEIID